MVTVQTIYEFLNGLYPVWLKEDYDNVGILAGDRNAPLQKALIALDITGAVIDEAARSSAELIISHHPIIFKPVKSVLAGGKTSALYQLIHHSLSAVCMHTNMDMANGGVNDVLADVLELRNFRILEVTESSHYKKITVFVPAGYEDKVREAMARAGAGKLGNYDGCAFAAKGDGYFRPLENANPFIGKQGVFEKTDETRIEAICAEKDLQNVLKAMIEAHPYEEPAYDLFDDAAVQEHYGIGRYGDISDQMNVDKFALFVKNRLGCTGVKVVNAGVQVKVAAVCGGADDGNMIDSCLQKGADTLVIGEMKHSSKIEAMEAGINVIEAGHYATENVICTHLQKILSSEFPQLDFAVAKANHDPAYFI